MRSGPSGPPSTAGARSLPAGGRSLPAGGTRMPSWQSTLIGLVLLAGVLATFLTLSLLDGIDAGLMAWSALGPLVGIVTGAMTTYFFAGANATAERDERLRAHESLTRERDARLAAEARMHLLMGLAGDQALDTAAKMSPNLFGGGAAPPVGGPVASSSP